MKKKKKINNSFKFHFCRYVGTVILWNKVFHSPLHHILSFPSVRKKPPLSLTREPSFPPHQLSPLSSFHIVCFIFVINFFEKLTCTFLSLFRGFPKSASEPNKKTTPLSGSKTSKLSNSEVSSSSGVEQDFAENCLKSHNNYRQKHGSPPLQLSKKVSIVHFL